MLPPITKPRILDVGCGSGVPTLELARISDGDIVAVDINKDALDRLVKKAAEEGLSGRITVIQVSMLEMDFPPGSFDIIWTEGAIAHVGLERGLRAWRDLLVPGGYLVVHDVMTDLKRKTESAGACGYTIIGQFEVPPSTWWSEYYAPLGRYLERLQEAGSSDEEVRREMETAQREIEEFDCDDDRFGSVFFVLRRS